MKRFLTNVCIVLILIGLFNCFLNFTVYADEEKYYDVQIPIFYGTTENFTTELLSGFTTSEKQKEGVIFVSLEDFQKLTDVEIKEGISNSIILKRNTVYLDISVNSGYTILSLGLNEDSIKQCIYLEIPIKEQNDTIYISLLHGLNAFGIEANILNEEDITGMISINEKILGKDFTTESLSYLEKSNIFDFNTYPYYLQISMAEPFDKFFLEFINNRSDYLFSWDSLFLLNNTTSSLGSLPSYFISNQDGITDYLIGQYEPDERYYNVLFNIISNGIPDENTLDISQIYEPLNFMNDTGIIDMIIEGTEVQNFDFAISYTISSVANVMEASERTINLFRCSEFEKNVLNKTLLSSDKLKVEMMDDKIITDLVNRSLFNKYIYNNYLSSFYNNQYALYKSAYRLNNDIKNPIENISAELYSTLIYSSLTSLGDFAFNEITYGFTGIADTLMQNIKHNSLIKDYILDPSETIGEIKDCYFIQDTTKNLCSLSIFDEFENSYYNFRLILQSSLTAYELLSKNEELLRIIGEDGKNTVTSKINNINSFLEDISKCDTDFYMTENIYKESELVKNISTVIVPVDFAKEVEKPDYNKYINDVLVPKYGYADTNTMTKNIKTANSNKSWGWDKRNGIIGFDILDMNNDGIDEMLLYRFMFDTKINSNVIYVDYFVSDSKGKIINKSTSKLSSNFYDMVGTISDYFVGGIININNVNYLYIENTCSGVFGDGSYIGYSFYCVDNNNHFVKKYFIGRESLGSFGPPDILLTLKEDGGYEEQLIWAIGDKLGESAKFIGLEKEIEGLLYGFDLIGMPKTDKLVADNKDVSDCVRGYSQVPSYFLENIFKPSFEYVAIPIKYTHNENIGETNYDFKSIVRNFTGNGTSSDSSVSDKHKEKNKSKYDNTSSNRGKSIDNTVNYDSIISIILKSSDIWAEFTEPKYQDVFEADVAGFVDIDFDGEVEFMVGLDCTSVYEIDIDKKTLKKAEFWDYQCSLQRGAATDFMSNLKCFKKKETGEYVWNQDNLYLCNNVVTAYSVKYPYFTIDTDTEHKDLSDLEYSKISFCNFIFNQDTGNYANFSEEEYKKVVQNLEPIESSYAFFYINADMRNLDETIWKRYLKESLAHYSGPIYGKADTSNQTMKANNEGFLNAHTTDESNSYSEGNNYLFELFDNTTMNTFESNPIDYLLSCDNGVKYTETKEETYNNYAIKWIKEIENMQNNAMNNSKSDFNSLMKEIEEYNWQFMKKLNDYSSNGIEYEKKYEYCKQEAGKWIKRYKEITGEDYSFSLMNFYNISGDLLDKYDLEAIDYFDSIDNYRYQNGLSNTSGIFIEGLTMFKGNICYTVTSKRLYDKLMYIPIQDSNNRYIMDVLNDLIVMYKM